MWPFIIGVFSGIIAGLEIAYFRDHRYTWSCPRCNLKVSCKYKKDLDVVKDVHLRNYDHDRSQ